MQNTGAGNFLNISLHKTIISFFSINVNFTRNGSFIKAVIREYKDLIKGRIFSIYYNNFFVQLEFRAI